MRRLIRATAIAAPCLLFLSFLLFARGLRLWSGLVFLLAFILFFAFPHFLTVPQNTQPDSAPGGWIARFSKYAVLMWVISQPEFTAFENRVIKGGALWDWRLITPLAVLTGYVIYLGLSRVSGITDRAIYHYLDAAAVPKQEG